MTTQTTVVGSPTLPRVNLLPPEIAEARQLRNIRLGAGGAVAATAVLVGMFYWHAHGGIAAAQDSLDTANSQTAKLQIQVKTYQNVTSVQTEVASAQNTLATAIGSRVLWSRYMQDMSVSLAGNYWFSSVVMAANTATPATASGPGATPFTDQSAIGSITIQGTAVSHFDVADLLRDLAKEPGLSHPVASNSTEGQPVNDRKLVTFGVVVPVDSNQQPTATAAGGTNSANTPTKAAGN